jgi:hypothetical protein
MRHFHDRLVIAVEQFIYLLSHAMPCDGSMMKTSGKLL